MKASETKLQRIIEGTNQYVVPLFQRTYSWDKREWSMLWDDIDELCDKDAPGNHFMGSIVTAPTQSVPEGVTKYLLIDGQQRLTTLFILLAAIRDRAGELNLGTLQPEIDETLLKNKFKQGNEAFKLLPTQADRDAFVRVMQAEAAPDGSQIRRAYQYFAKCIRNPPDRSLETLKRVVVSNLLLVSIVLDPDDNPHLIFESLNAKGRALSQADLIRNYFFMKIHIDDQERQYNRHWKPMQDSLGDDLTECIRHFLMKDGPIVKQGEVYFALKDGADSKSQAEILQYLEELTEYAGYYSKLLRPDEEQELGLRERLGRLRRIEVTTAYPFLLNGYRDYTRGQLSQEEFLQVLDVVENFMVRRWVCSVPSFGLNKIFPPLYGQARQHGPLVDGLKEVLRTKNYPRDAEFRERLCASKLYAPGERVAKTKLILERLEQTYGHREPVTFDDLQIEHVMPQTLTDWWRSNLGESGETTHELLLHTLGNLTLTGYNASLSNASYPEKRRILSDSHLELNRVFEDVLDWNEATIKLRAESLADVALSVWPYFGAQESQYTVPGGDVTGRVPAAVVVFGQRFPATTWRDVAQRTLEAIDHVAHDQFQDILRQFPRFLAADPSQLRSSRKLDNGIYMLTNLSAQAINRYCIQITESLGLSSEDWRVEYA